VVPDFEYLKERRVANAKEWVRLELEDLARELPEYQRVHDFIFRAEPLPRTTTRKIRRFELRDELAASGGLGTRRREAEEVVLSAADRELMNSPAGRVFDAAVKRHVSDVLAIHPRMNLEIDLGLDSLARAELITSLEQALGVEIKSEEAATALTVGEVIRLANAKVVTENPKSSALLTTSGLPTERASPEPTNAAGARWHKILSGTPTDIPELRPLLGSQRIEALLARFVLRLIYIGARLLFRMEVTGSDVLRRLKPPYLICPNHQSYLDPFLVCSTFPPGMLPHVVHVGASKYFTSFAMAQLARLIHVLPIDPDVHLRRAMRAGAAALREGRILNIYPEGHRSFDGQVRELKKGAAILATELNVPIVPVALDGTYRIWPRKSRRIRLSRVKVRFGEPIYALEVASAELDEEIIYERVMVLLKGRIEQMLSEMHAIG